MNDSENGPIIPPMEGEPGLKEYHCPHCDRFLFRGRVQRLKMSCPHCLKMIDSDGLSKPVASNIGKNATDG